MLAMFFVACAEFPIEIPTEIGIAPVPTSEIPEEVAAFFDENLHRIAQPIFHKDNTVHRIDTCVMINSSDEFNFPDGIPAELSAIDFDTYTLVIGQWGRGNTCPYLMSQSLVVEKNVAIINLTIEYKPEEGFLYEQFALPVPFWGLYPKITAETIHTNVKHPK
jgi:hypothetical protein